MYEYITIFPNHLMCNISQYRFVHSTGRSIALCWVVEQRKWLFYTSCCSYPWAIYTYRPRSLVYICHNSWAYTKDFRFLFPSSRTFFVGASIAASAIWWNSITYYRKVDIFDRYIVRVRYAEYVRCTIFKDAWIFLKFT